jgi:hypothetical protein
MAVTVLGAGSPIHFAAVIVSASLAPVKPKRIWVKPSFS